MWFAVFDRDQNNRLGSVVQDKKDISPTELSNPGRYGIIEVPEDLGLDVVNYVVNSTEDGFIFSQESKDRYDESFRETELDFIRQLRLEKIKETDKYALPDWPHKTPEIRQAWLDYRQALRDFPEVVDVKNHIWPTPPE